ncbi:MAG TPA: SCO family protein [Chthoniobacterales bacterium]
MRPFFFSLTILVLVLRTTPVVAGLSPDDMKKITYDQHIGQQLSPGLIFQDSTGRQRALGDIFTTKPTLLVLGYYHCPMLCTLINDGLIEALQELRFNVGRDFNVINLSIDPHETPNVAAAKKKEYLRRYGRPGAADGWHFLTGNEQSIAQLANEAGFRYQLDPVSNEYAHPSGFIVLTPDGKISRYFFGVNFEPKELRSAIIAASKGERGSVVKQLILLCCEYNPITGQYGALVLTVLRVLGVGTVVLLVGWIVWMSRRDSHRQASTEAG